MGDFVEQQTLYNSIERSLCLMHNECSEQCLQQANKGPRVAVRMLQATGGFFLFTLFIDGAKQFILTQAMGNAVLRRTAAVGSVSPSTFTGVRTDPTGEAVDESRPVKDGRHLGASS